jgi:transposase InsO family protein
MNSDARPPQPFNPDGGDSSGQDWEEWKTVFDIYLGAKGLDEAAGKRKVKCLLNCLGEEAIKLYGTFKWNAAVAADNDHGIVAVPAEDKHDLDQVLKKFDGPYGHSKYRKLRRKKFLGRVQEDKESVMKFIGDLQHLVKDCEYGELADSMLCDKILDGVQDTHVFERLMDLDEDELTVRNCIRIARASELTSEHTRSRRSGEKKESATVHAAYGRGGGRARGRPRGRGRYGSGQGQGHSRGYGGNPGNRGGYSGNGGQYINCDNCCKQHRPGQCPAAGKYCGNCGQQGHFFRSPKCAAPRSTSNSRGNSRGDFRGNRARGRGRGKYVYMTDYSDYADNVEPGHYDQGDVYGDNACANNSLSQMFDDCTFADVYRANTGDDDGDWCVDMKVSGKTLRLELDSGAKCNVLSWETLQNLNVYHELLESDVFINGVHGQSVRAKGYTVLPCKYKNVVHDVLFQILDGSRPVNLLGRKDSLKFDLISSNVNLAIADDSCRVIVNEYQDVLGDSIGCIPGEYDIKIDGSIQPVIHASRPVPVAIREQVKKELDHLEKCCIIKRVNEPTEWVSSMVCMSKKNGRVRICIDPSDLNRAILREHFPMNSIEDVATRLHGSKFFSTLDANSGYFQIMLSERSSLLTTFNTPFGRYRYLRMPMGAKCSADVFQRAMTSAFEDFEGVEVVVDDILVHGKTLKEHNKRLVQVLEKARAMNLKLNSIKCKIGMSEVDYVGHRLTGEGLRPTPDRVKAITGMRDPTDFAELETVLGMISYVSKFIPQLSELNAPLRALKKNDTWSWGPEEKKAFLKIKEALSSNQVLRYYDVKQQVKLTVDASMKGLGASIIQGNAVVAYASRALSETEQRYAQIEKEALAVVYGCTHFHKLVYGQQNVIIESDHKPLENIMQKPIHKAPMRIQRMLLKLQPYDFKLIHVSGKSIGLADCLSRLPHDKSDHLMDDELMVCSVDSLAGSSHAAIAQASSTDSELLELKKVIVDGWPHSKADLPVSVMPFWEYKEELSTYNGIVYRGVRICVPNSMRAEMIKIIHSSHQGIVKSKQRARDLIFWPGMNSMIAEAVGKCQLCLAHRDKQPKEPMTIHPLPNRPWSKVGADKFEIDNRHFLIMVDYYSNFIEVEPLSTQHTSSVVRAMKANIARYGIMDVLISDNGPQFSSREFQQFTMKYGIEHNTSSPLYPKSNGLAEKAVQTVKETMEKCIEADEDIYLALLDLRNTPRDNEMGSPAQRLMGRRTRTLLPTSEPLLEPQTIDGTKVKEHLGKYRMTQKGYYDKGSRALPEIKPGDAIRVSTPQGWKPAEYMGKHSAPRSYMIRAGDQARTYRRNRNQLLVTREKPHTVTPRPTPFARIPVNDRQRTQASRGNIQPQPAQDNTPPPKQRVEKETPPRPPQSPAPPANSPVRTRSGRETKKPGWMRDMVEHF